MPDIQKQPLISELCSIETSNTDLAHAQDSDLDDSMRGDEPVPTEQLRPQGVEPTGDETPYRNRMDETPYEKQLDAWDKTGIVYSD